ncbi:DUF6247 family protein [Actinomycetospora termitidis]|uniref:DUF6247 family protein n=1 Tax=Actinomycetospora termitidis TaxID=3053470 RepID=A0ABT7MH70_9PSEU|nr:DUF6247 family protein [Actinomycetospora sp. Odt1-22]MDL5158683.1 DUF6247 family protein [Actinomycetospora sp. Odt1-22]
MSASWSIDADPPARPLGAGASPESIHAALDPEDQVRFRQALETASESMRRELDLTPVFSVLEEFRRLAILQTNRGSYHRVIRAAAAMATGEESPRDEPFEVTRAKAGF